MLLGVATAGEKPACRRAGETPLTSHEASRVLYYSKLHAYDRPASQAVSVVAAHAITVSASLS